MCSRMAQFMRYIWIQPFRIIVHRRFGGAPVTATRTPARNHTCAPVNRRQEVAGLRQ